MDVPRRYLDMGLAMDQRGSSISHDNGKQSSNTLLDEIPDSIGSRHRLQVLDVTRNHLSKLPDSIGELVLLHRFEASGNWLEV
jgi:Leucine-rich repeat (LRR) protein